MLQRDLPRAISEFDEAETTYVAIGAEAYLPRVHADHAQVLADAALFDDADGLVSPSARHAGEGRQRDRDGGSAGHGR